MGFLFKWILILSIVYYILKHFVFPAFRISVFTNNRMQQMQDKIKEMEQKMNQAPAKGTNTRKEGEYIDYEEVK